MNEVLILAIIWMNIENAMLNKISHTQKTNITGFHIIIIL